MKRDLLVLVPYPEKDLAQLQAAAGDLRVVTLPETAPEVQLRQALESARAVIGEPPVALLQGDRVVAQTVTDANGQFHFNVKKGSYTLRVTTTNAETGETVTRYAAISAPANGSVVTF